MTSLMSKTGLYDLLSMVLPGYLVLFLIVKCLPINHCWEYDETTYFIAAFCVSYVVGLIVHYMSRRAFCWLSCRCLREKAYHKFREDEMKRGAEQANNEKLTTRWYYRNYYALWGNNSINYISVMEIQLTFLRSMAVVGFLYTALGCLFLKCQCWAISLFFLYALICTLLTVFIQKKIYYYYYEAYEYRSEENK